MPCGSAAAYATVFEDCDTCRSTLFAHFYECTDDGKSNTNRKIIKSNCGFSDEQMNSFGGDNYVGALGAFLGDASGSSGPTFASSCDECDEDDLLGCEPCAESWFDKNKFKYGSSLLSLVNIQVATQIYKRVARRC